MVNKNSRHKGRRSSFTSNGKKKKKTPKNVKGTSIRRKKSKKRKQKLQIERMSTMRGGASNLENMDAVFREKVEKFAKPDTLHMVCGLAGEYCVLDTAVNLGLHFPKAHVLYLDNYTEYAAFNKMFIHSPGFLSDCRKKLNEMSSKNNFYRQKTLEGDKLNELLSQSTNFCLWVIDMQNDFLPLPFEESPSGGSFAVQESSSLVEAASTELKTLEACLEFEDELPDTLEKILNPLADIFKTPELTPDGKTHFTDLKEFWTKTNSINELMTALSAYIKNTTGKNLEIIYSRDAHPKGHCSFENHKGIYPAHCVQGEPGEEINKKIINTATTIQNEQSAQIQQSVVFKACTADADSYSAVPYHSSYSQMKTRQVGTCEYVDNKVKEYYQYYDTDDINKLLSESSKIILEELDLY